ESRSREAKEEYLIIVDCREVGSKAAGSIGLTGEQELKPLNAFPGVYGLLYCRIGLTGEQELKQH
ncbi:hypothetical protein HKBW3S42_02021, partial [Candidatus Hakubella thermalkaliphila]